MQEAERRRQLYRKEVEVYQIDMRELKWEAIPIAYGEYAIDVLRHEDTGAMFVSTEAARRAFAPLGS